MKLTAERLREVLAYDAETGAFTWRVMLSSRGPVGSLAGSLSGGRYRQIRIDGIPYWAHRLAWLYMTGEYPSSDIDHRDTDKTNNAWVNLRLATDMQNHRNVGLIKTNTSGHPCVGWLKTEKRWRVHIKRDGVRLTLGQYKTFDDAVAVHVAYVKKMDGEFLHQSFK